MSSTVVFADASPPRSGRFETAPGGSRAAADTGGGPGGGADLTEKKEIVWGIPLSSSVKFSLVNPVAGELLLLAITSTSTSLVPARNVGADGSCGAAIVIETKTAMPVAPLIPRM